VNRPKKKEDFYEGNSYFTENLINLLKENKLSIPLVMTSSVQATLDNDYGKSKKQAEDTVLDYAKNNKSYVYRLHNVFGKWCRPNYNSVVATFCDSITNDRSIKINDPDLVVELVYIDDICYEFINLLNGKVPTYKIGDYCYIYPKYEITVGKLADQLYKFKDSMNSLYVPRTGDEFTKKLYSTFISYIPFQNMVFDLESHEDERGNFVELLRTNEVGQFAISFSKPDVSRGNHYHHTKMERFIVVKGCARVQLQKIDDGTYYQFEVSGEKIQSVTIPVGYTHKIENIGDGEMILIIWGNELFEEAKPDTFFRKVVIES
jgi:UDP-2-acetamido-2,6-beta-L-arabino-hexul-4-ose reductase